MIPKVIHYCWFGRNPLPPLAQKCIESWKKFLPDYEIKEWNEDNFDVYITTYTEEAYRLKKYAFVSDYARFWILYHYGGLYFDTDVEIIRPLDDIIAKGNFMGLEKMEGLSGATALAVAPGLGLGCNPGLGLGKQILDFYEKHHYISWKGRMTGTVVNFTTKLLYQNGIAKGADGFYHCDDITIYPEEYFDPLNYYTQELTITENTRSIHRYAASWTHKKRSVWDKIQGKLVCIFTKLFVGLRRTVKH